MRRCAGAFCRERTGCTICRAEEALYNCKTKQQQTDNTSRARADFTIGVTPPSGQPYMSSAPAQTVPTAAETVRRATELLAVVFATAGVDDSHGILHAQQVLRNLDAALAAAEHPISAERHLACRLAALLHDADDAKYFPKTQKTCVGVGAGGNTGKGDVAGECCSTECAGSGVEREDSSGESEDSGQAGNYPNAASVAARAGAPLHVAADMLRMIACVSCSTNGNDVPPEAVDEPELLWPRWADRLEAVGEVGVARCYVYNTHVVRSV